MSDSETRNETTTEPDKAVGADLVAKVSGALDVRDAAALKIAVADLEDADMADLLGLLEPEQRHDFVTLLGTEFRPTVLSELDYGVKEQLLDEMSNDAIAKAVSALDSDEAVYVLEDMEAEDQAEVLSKLSADERATIERSLDYPEESAGRLMQADFIAVPPFWTVGQVIDHMRDTSDLPDTFSEIYVVDPTFHLIGIVHLDRLLRSKRPVVITEVMESDPQSIPAGLDQEEVARHFDRYNLVAAPVIDANARLVGVVTADDVVEIIQEEAEEDILRLGGVGDESVTDTVPSIARSRFPWLFVNLFTALLASSVISLFDATIEQMVALAVLMPIVASMGGNAGTQTMTVAVRALATRDLTAVNALRVIWRESAVGLVNGLVFATIIATVAYFWFGSQRLGLVIGAAMVVNLLAAALAGILIPLALSRQKLDPAVSSGVFVTCVTDVVGFFAFLGLAALWLEL